MPREREIFGRPAGRGSSRDPAAGAASDAAARPLSPGTMSALMDALARPPDAPAQPLTPLAPGASVGRYELVRELGRGGFGVVYEARDRELGRLVALKVVEPRRGVAPAAIREEAEAAAQLQHPNIVTVHDAGTAGERAWIVLEHLRGETLEARLRRGALRPDEALALGIAVARGLAHAHRAGVVHRDLKPANVFLCEDGAVKILDFGLSRVFGAGSLDGGTPAYMAPERWRGEPGDERADVFAAGAVLFEAIAGRRPYGIADERSAALEAERPPALGGRIPAKLRRAVAAAIDPDPARRPSDGAAWLELLLAARSGRRPARVAWSLGAGLALAALGAGAALQLRGPPAEPEPAPGARIPVAVADVQNGTADPELNGLSGMLVTSLEQSRGLAVLTRSRLVDGIRQLGREPPEIIDEALAREVGRVLDVRALLLATVHRFDDLYAIELRALDPSRNEYLFTLKEEGRGKASVPQLIDRLAQGTRERLRVAAGEAAGTQRAVTELTTSSLAAYEHFFRARQAMDLRRFERAREEIEAALRVDPDFALAHHARVVLDSWTRRGLSDGGLERPSARPEREHLESALRRVDRLPEKERLALLAWKASLDGRVDEAFRLRDAAAQAFPQDKEAVFWAGDVRFHQEDFAGAIPFFERALALDPDYRLALEHQIFALRVLGRRAEVLTLARRWAETARDDEGRRVLGIALLLNDRRAEAEEAFRSAGAPAAWRGAALASWLAHRGELGEALSLLRSVAADGGGREAKGTGRELVRLLEPDKVLPQVLALQGRWREAERAHLRALAGAEPEEHAMERLGFAVGTRSPGRVRAAVARIDALEMSRSPLVAVRAALALAVAGEAAAARVRAESLRLGGRWERLPRPEQELLDALLAWREGNLDEAARRLAALAAGPDVALRYIANVLGGELAIERGAPAEAIGPLEQAIAEPWMPGDDAWWWLHPRALYHLALAHERTGDLRRARARADQLLALWAQADADLPLLAETRALRRRLEAPGPAAAPPRRAAP